MKGSGGLTWYLRCGINTSGGLMEATFMPMRTAALLITGSGTDRIDRRSIGPYSGHTTAFINTPLLLAAQLTQSAEPVFEVVGLRDFSVADGLNVDCHDAEA